MTHEIPTSLREYLARVLKPHEFSQFEMLWALEHQAQHFAKLARQTPASPAAELRRMARELERKR